MTSRTRSITWGRKSGVGAPLRSSTHSRLSVQIAQPDRDVFVARIEPPLQLGVPDGRADRIGIGNAVSCDVDRAARQWRSYADAGAAVIAGQRGRSDTRAGARLPVTERSAGVGVSNTQGVFQGRLTRRRLVHVPYTESPQMTTRLEPARQLPKTAPSSHRASEVRSMQRGMRWLALRGTSARPATWRPAYSRA